jgi:protein tyrosine phosphatase (PTP) superfamily phosphohydrolase (DUF442 family)
MAGDHHKIFNYLRLSPRLTTSGMPQFDEIKLIAGLAPNSVISLVPEGVGSDLAGEEDLVTTRGMAFHRIPVIWERPQVDDFRAFRKLMDRLADQVLHVHCEANMRVSVFMALYRMIARSWPRERAMVPIAEIWKPNETWQRFISRVMEAHKEV